MILSLIHIRLVKDLVFVQAFQISCITHANWESNQGRVIVELEEGQLDGRLQGDYKKLYEFPAYYYQILPRFLTLLL